MTHNKKLLVAAILSAVSSFVAAETAAVDVQEVWANIGEVAFTDEYEVATSSGAALVGQSLLTEGNFYVTGYNTKTGGEAGAYVMFTNHSGNFELGQNSVIYADGFNKTEDTLKDCGYVSAVSLGASAKDVTFENLGTIYVRGDGTSSYKVKGISVDAGKAVNSGSIHVLNAAAMTSNSHGASLTNSLVNNGAITVVSTDDKYAVGMIENGSKTGSGYDGVTEMTNGVTGSIVATGTKAYGVKIESGFNEPNETVFTNEGSIVASEEAKAIDTKWAFSNTRVIMKGEASEVTGVMALGSSTALDISEVGVKTYDLDATQLRELSLTNSKVTFEGTNQSTQFVSFETDSNSSLTIVGPRSLTIDVLNVTDEDGIATFAFDEFTEDPNLTVKDGNAKETVVTFGPEAIDNLDQGTAQEKLQDAVVLQEGADGVTIGNGTNYTVRVDEKGNATVTGSDITKMTNDLAAASLVAWRNEITTLNDRMSTLRTSPSTIGAWVRYNGGEYQYDARSMKHQFNTIEVGADAKVSDNWIVGASFAYTKGDGDYEQGETETDTYSGAFYALWTHEKGSFVDFVMKAGRMENDFDFYNLTGGAYDNGTLEHTGFVMGIETGHRFALPMNAFVEPQLQLTYSRLSSVSETTAARHVELDAMDSLVGRVGIMAGIDCPNDRGSAYVKISALRDFRGDIDGTYSSVTGGGAYSLSQELDDNWFEYAVGGNFKLSDNAYLFADVAKSAGGDIDLDWRANVGAKLFF